MIKAAPVMATRPIRGWKRKSTSTKIGSPESVKRYAMRQDGSYYGAHLEKLFQERGEAALKAMDEAGREQAARAATTSGYWLAELAVPPFPMGSQALDPRRTTL